jgi:hypothetical protein
MAAPASIPTWSSRSAPLADPRTALWKAVVLQLLVLLGTDHAAEYATIGRHGIGGWLEPDCRALGRSAVG